MEADNSALDSPPWPGRRWISAVAIVFVIQISFIFYLGERKQLPRVERRYQTQVLLAAGPVSDQRAMRAGGWSDPTLFALANVHGFSGAAWLQFEPPAYQLAEWTEPPRWLQVDRGELGGHLVTFVATNRPLPLQVAAPSGIDWSSQEIYVAPPIVTTQSTVLVEVPDLGRSVESYPVLPSWRHNDILSNTVIQVLVNVAGQSLTGTVLAESGLREADEYALRTAVGTKFKGVAGPVTPAESGGEKLMLARLTFRWHTLPPGGTNQASGTIGPP